MDCIIVDGPDGSGKSTLTRKMASEAGSYRIHFPTEQKDLSSMTEEGVLLHFLSDFESTLQDVPENTKTLILDRSFVSTIAYQGFSEDGFSKEPWALESAKNIGMRQIQRRAKSVTFVYLYCSVGTMLERLEQEPEHEKDQVSALGREGKREKLEAIDTCYRRAYATLKSEFPDCEYLSLTSENNSPQDIIKDFRQQSS